MSKPAPSRSEAGPRLQRVLSGIAAQAEADFARMKSCPEGAVHALRRRMKKLRSVLPLVRGHVPAKTMSAIKQQAKRLKDAFASQRDQEVMTRLAANIGGVALVVRIRKQLRRTAPPPRAPTAEAARDLQRLIADLDLRAMTWDEVASAHERTVRKARRARRAAHDEPDEEAFHEWRKRTKTLFFQLVLFHPRTRKARKRTDAASRLGHWLGQLHDLDSLRKRLGKRRAGDDDAWWREIDRRSHRLVDRVLSLSPRNCGLCKPDESRNLLKECAQLATA